MGDDGLSLIQWFVNSIREETVYHTFYYTPEGKQVGESWATYGAIGQILSASGSRTVATADTPEAGWITETQEDYKLVDGTPTWVPVRREEKTAGFDGPHIPGGAPQYRREYTYTDGAWQPSGTCTLEWVHGSILHYDDPEEQVYEMYTATGRLIGDTTEARATRARR